MIKHRRALNANLPISSAQHAMLISGRLVNFSVRHKIGDTEVGLIFFTVVLFRLKIPLS